MVGSVIILLKPPVGYDLSGQASQFHIYLLCLCPFNLMFLCFTRFLIEKVLGGTFNKEKVLYPSRRIVKLHEGSLTALVSVTV